MKVGIVSTWLHRGGTYVTINYAKLLMPTHEVYVYARAGEFFDDNLHMENVNVYRAPRIGHRTEILYSDFSKWIKKNGIQMIIWNEQREFDAICRAKKEFPSIPHGAYIDYYKEDTIPDFAVFDFLICNTKRHYSAFSWHPQVYYMAWGCDTELYKPMPRRRDSDDIVFFHSMGMSDRKGTDVLVKVFCENHLKNKGAKLIIHTQVNVDNIITSEEAKKNGIEIIKKTVEAPGLYHLGDVYVYPAKLDGLGLTLYEAIACGLPVIATNVAPMNEVINESNGYLVDVKRLYCRNDGYYWPQADVDEKSLLEGLMYFIDKKTMLEDISREVRTGATKNWNLEDRKKQLLEIIENVKTVDNLDAIKQYECKNVNKERIEKRAALLKLFVPIKVQAHIKLLREKLRKR